MQAVPSSKVIVKKLFYIGKPEPEIVKTSPPLAFTSYGETDETTNANVMSATPEL